MKITLDLYAELPPENMPLVKSGVVVINGTKVIESIFSENKFIFDKQNHKTNTSEKDYIYERNKRGVNHILIGPSKEMYLIKPNFLQRELLMIWNQKRWIYEKENAIKLLFTLLGVPVGWLISSLTGC